MSCSGTLARGVGTGLVLLMEQKENVNRSQYVRVHVCLLARATRAVGGRKSKGDARSGRTGARTESACSMIGRQDFFAEGIFSQSNLCPTLTRRWICACCTSVRRAGSIRPIFNGEAKVDREKKNARKNKFSKITK